MQGALRRSLSESDLKETKGDKEDKKQKKEENGKEMETDDNLEVVEENNLGMEMDENEKREVSIRSLQVVINLLIGK